MVVLGQADYELVGHQPLVAGQELGLGIEFTLQPRGDLHRLYVALERAREGAADGSLHFLLKARENAHVPPFPEVKLDGIRRMYGSWARSELSYNRCQVRKTGGEVTVRSC